MITQLHLQDFKGHHDTRLELGQLTMLVGDNASGKTSVLEALELLMSAARDPDGLLRRSLAPEDLCRRGAKRRFMLATTSRHDRAEKHLSITVIDTGDGWMASFDADEQGQEHQAAAYLGTGARGPSLDPRGDWDAVRAAAPAAALYRFEPTKIAAGAYSDRPDAPVKPDGARTATALAALKLGDDEAFARIEAAMRELVPSLERVRIRPAKVSRRSKRDTVIGSKVYFDFRGSPDVPAHHASYGTLILLALLTVLHGKDRRPELILLDDFDHALHPRAQMELVRMIRKLLALDDFKAVQILATTHSPYMLDVLPPEDVIAFALRPDGTVASRPLSEHPDAAKAKGALKSGELWTLDEERTWVL